MSDMSNEVAKEVLTCGTCGATVKELRRGRCWSCYTRWSDQRPVGLGACCAVCDERRRDNLRLVEVQGRSLAMCHLCAARVGKLDVVPYSIEGLRAALRRDRRQVERRESAADTREGEVAERRAAQRRGQVAAGSDSIGLLGRDPALWQLGQSPRDLDLDLDQLAAASPSDASEGSEDGGELAVGDEDIVEATVVAESPRKPAAAPVA
jgi:hypothetical protein